jgi:hypothetical protein
MLQRRPLEPVLRRAGGTAKATRWRAGSLGVGKSFRCAQMATGTSGARCSSAAAMVAAAGLGVSREQGRRGGFYSRAQVEVVRDGPVNSTAWHGARHGANRTMTCGGAVTNGERRARPVGERHVDCPRSPLTSCTGANTRGAQTPVRGPASACVYGDVRQWADVAGRDVARAVRRQNRSV